MKDKNISVQGSNDHSNTTGKSSKSNLRKSIILNRSGLYGDDSQKSTGAQFNDLIYAFLATIKQFFLILSKN